MYRNTYVEVNLKNIESNVKKIINKYNNYKYYLGVVKADCYGHYDIKTIEAIISGGCNYLAVATLDEALEIRKYLDNVDILCLGYVPYKYLDVARENNIAITITNYYYFEHLDLNKLKGIKIHLKLNTGMNRLGLNTKEEVNEVYNAIIDNNLELEGIFSHIYNPQNEEDTLKQFKQFEYLTSDIDLSKIKIIHIGATETTIKYSKHDYINACRLGIGMYGFGEDLELDDTFSLISEVIQINEVENGKVGYNGIYEVKDKEYIAVIPIGYADGIIRQNKDRFVYINDKKYQIVGNVCMDMLFVKVDETVKMNDKVYIIKDNKHILEIANHLHTIPYEIICSIGKRVPRIYTED